jgi:ABC-2 type transport system ATP-binding protein
VLDELSFEITPGERCCLLGANGSGKSTLLDLILGLSRPTAGTLEVLGRDPLDPSLKTERGVLLDRTSFSYEARVGEIVRLYHGFYEAPVDPAPLLHLFDLGLNACVRHLSKGQRQRLGILLAVLGAPSLLLLDEPASGLDPHARVKLWEVIRGWHSRNPGCTLLFTTHDLAEADLWAGRIGILHKGRLLAWCSRDELCLSVIGARRKLTLLGPGLDARRLNLAGAVSCNRIGSELAVYTDDPEHVIKSLRLNDSSIEVRIENVAVRDAYFRLTGENFHEAVPFAFPKPA